MEDFLNDVIKERSDFAELSTKALRAAILEELAYAKHVREHMPNGVSLKRHFNAQEDTLHGLISKVNHICRVVKDADVSVKFYQKIMGARLLNRPRFATNGFWLWLGNVQLHLIQSSLTVVPDHDDAPAGRVNHMSFDVFNIQDCEERLTEAGVKFSKVYYLPDDTTICSRKYTHHPLDMFDRCLCPPAAAGSTSSFSRTRTPIGSSCATAPRFACAFTHPASPI